jgi:tRNA A37 methylthiotransferase MiaB
MIRGVRRIRLGSIEPIQITDEFKEILNESWMGRYLHIALQHTNKEMLNIMNRRNRVKSDLELFELLASKGYALGTDFIVGHPEETNEFWNDAMQNIDKFPLTHIHSFRYSKRDGTPSSNMNNQVNGAVAKNRLEELELKIFHKNIQFREKKQKLDILIESYKDGFYVGYDQFFNSIKIKSNIDLVGDWIEIDNYKVKDTKNVSEF